MQNGKQKQKDQEKREREKNKANIKSFTMLILPFFILSHIESLFTMSITNDILNTTMKMQTDDTDS